MSSTEDEMCIPKTKSSHFVATTVFARVVSLIKNNVFQYIWKEYTAA